MNNHGTTTMRQSSSSTGNASNNISSSSETRPLLGKSKDKKKNDDTDAAGDDEGEITLRIKCTSSGIQSSESSNNSSGDYEIVTKATVSVHHLKESVRNGIGEASRGRYLRLIAGGRLLAPDTAPLSKFTVKDGDCVHAVIAAAGVRGGMQAAMARGLAVSDGRPSRNNGSGIGSTGLITSMSSNDSDDDLEAGVERTGFDRLRADGLTRDEIGAIRLYFSQHVDRFAEERERTRVNEEDNPHNSSSTTTANEEEEGNSARLARLRLEDAWMITQGPHSEFRLNLNSNNPLLMGNSRILLGSDDIHGNIRRGAIPVVGTDRDFIWGFFLGFFVGYVMMFWVWLPTVPHKQKLGILTGISFNLLLNMIKTDGPSDFNVNGA